MSAKTLLSRSEGILKLRGRWADYHHPRLPHPIPALPTVHPAYLLRQPAQKREAWRDLLSFAEAMEREGLGPAAVRQPACHAAQPCRLSTGRAARGRETCPARCRIGPKSDRKSTRLNSSH